MGGHKRFIQMQRHHVGGAALLLLPAGVPVLVVVCPYGRILLLVIVPAHKVLLPVRAENRRQLGREQVSIFTWLLGAFCSSLWTTHHIAQRHH